MSEQIDQLATALAKAQGEMSVARKDKNNPFFKSSYADFESIISASRPSLAKHGLSVVQPPFVYEGDSSYLVTILMHSSGQWIKSKAKHNPLKTDVQSLSSYNTYLKRMCYASLIGVATGEDDDGNAASEPQRIAYKAPVRINQEQVNSLMKLPEERQQKICSYNNVNHLDELTVEQYDKVMNMLKNGASK